MVIRLSPLSREMSAVHPTRPIATPAVGVGFGAKPEAADFKNGLPLSADSGRSPRSGAADWFDTIADLRRDEHFVSHVPTTAREQVQQNFAYSITSSARAITEADTVMPSALAVLRLMLTWKRAGCSNGRSAGLAPFKMRSI